MHIHRSPRAATAPRSLGPTVPLHRFTDTRHIGRHLRVVSAVLVAAMTATLSLVLATPSTAIAPFPIIDSGAGTSGQVNPNWTRIVSGTGSTGGTYTSDGWTRLTNRNTNQATNLINPVAFPSSTGFQVEFDYRMAGGATSSGLTGDGMAMYLINGAENVSVGANGSGLAYAGNSAGCGVIRGYLGVGLDVFGNYSSPTQFASGGPGSRPSAIALRGSGTRPCTANQASNFPWVGSATVAGLWTGTTGNTQDPASVATSTYRRVKIVVTPTVTSVRVQVFITPATAKSNPPGAYTSVLNTTLDAVSGQVALPSTLKLGFSAATGSATNFQDVRNVQVSATVDASVSQVLSPSTPGHVGYPAATFLAGDPISFDAVARNLGPSTIGDPPDGVARYVQDLRGLPISGVTWTCTPQGGATCDTGGGTGSLVSENWHGPTGSSVDIHVTGTAQGTRGTFQSVGVIPTDFANNTVGANGSSVQINGGAIDVNTANNTSQVQFQTVAPLLSVTKTATAATVGVGQPVAYTATITNTGTAPGTANFSDVVPSTVDLDDVTCAGTGGATCTSGFSGQNVTGTVDIPAGGTVAVTMSGTAVAPGSAQNSATLTVTTPDCTAECGGGVDASAPVTVQPVALELVKTASSGGAVVAATSAGEPITYSFAVTNTGGFPIDSLAIEEISFTGTGTMPPITCPVTTIAPLEEVTCQTTTPYILTQEDVDAGATTNVARATGSIPGRADPILSDTSSETVSATPFPSLALVKDSTSAPIEAAGDIVAYSFSVTNTGNVTLSGVEIVEESFTGTGDSPTPVCEAGADSLAPLQTVTCTASYTVTQADLDAGIISNTAHASALTPDSTAVQTATERYDVAPVINQELTLGITPTPSSVSAAGDAVALTYTVTNTGNATITDLAVVEAEFSGTGTPPVVSCPSTALAPGATASCTATYTVTQADVDAGVVTLAAAATGQSLLGLEVQSAQADSSIAIPRAAALGISAVAVPSTANLAGEEIDFSLDVTNNGNVTIDEVSAAVTAFTGTGTAPSVTCPDLGPLPPGGVRQCVTQTPYVVTQADMDSSGFSLTAVATATDPDAAAVSSAAGVADVTIAAAPSLSLVKTVSPSVPGAYVAGDELTYSFAMENTGNVTLIDVAPVEQSFSGSGTPSTPTCPVGAASMAPGDTVTCTSTYLLTQEDIDQGSVANVALAQGTTAFGAVAVDSAESSATVTIDEAASLSVGAVATPATVSAVGDVVAYSLEVANLGNVTLTDVTARVQSFTGSGTAPAVTCPSEAASLLPGASVTCTTSYTVTQADLDAGTFDLVAIATGGLPAGGTTDSATSTATVTVTQAPSLTVAVSAPGPIPTAAGQEIDYAFVVSNTGNVSLSTLTVAADSFSGTGTAPDIVCDAASIAPGTDVSCTASYAVTQADIDAATVSLVVTATGVAPGAADATASTPVTFDLTLAGTSTLTLAAAADLATFDAVGTTVTYTFTVTNSGTVTATAAGVTLNSATGTGAAPVISCPPQIASIAPGGSVSCTASYITTQADIDAASITVTATAEGLGLGGTAIASTPASVTVTASATPALTLAKTMNPSGTGVHAAGETVAFTYLATNTGNTTLTNVGIATRSFTGTSGKPTLTCDIAGPVTLAPGAELACTASYVLTQPDVDSGGLASVSYAAATAPGAVAVTSPDQATGLTITPTTSLLLGASVLPATATLAGTTTTYSFALTNAGNVTLSAGAVRIDAFSGSGGTPNVICPVEAASIAPTQVVTCTATYAVTQTDMDQGSVSLTATAGGTAPDTSAVASDQVSVPLTTLRSPAVSVDATYAPVGLAQYVAGQSIGFSLLVTNIGNVTLAPVAASATAFTGTGALSAVSCPPEAASLAPAASVTCTASYVLTQADVDSGAVDLTAVATGTPPGGGAAVQSAPDGVTVTIDRVAEIGATFAVSPASVTTAGQNVSYSVTATNTGTVALSSITVVQDSFTGGGTPPPFDCPPGAASLAPGASVTCTSVYPVTQADIDQGTFERTLRVTGVALDLGEVTSAAGSLTVTSPATPALTLVKSADPNDEASFVVGQEITFSYVARNTGNVTLANVSIVEQSFTGSGTPSAISCPPGSASLAPGETVKCTNTYTLTQADIDSDTIANIAVAQSAAPAGGPPVVSNASTVQLPAPPLPVLTLEKSGTRLTPEEFVAGATITYTFDVRNEGNLTLFDARVIEQDFTGTGALSPVSCPPEIAILAPGEGGVCTASYTLVQEDIDRGTLSNSAIASATTPRLPDPVESAVSTFALPVDQSPSLALDQMADPVEVTRAGEVVTFTFTAHNTGNVTISDLVLKDLGASAIRPAGGPIACTFGTTRLAPATSTSCEVRYTVQQSDIDAGGFEVLVAVTGKDPNGIELSSTASSQSIGAAPSFGIELTHSASVTVARTVGEEIGFVSTVRNSGTGTLESVSVRVESFSGTGPAPVPTCPITTLAPGESVSCASAYQVTAADLAALTPLTMSVTAQGTEVPGGAAVTSEPQQVEIRLEVQPGPTPVLPAYPPILPATGPGQTPAPYALALLLGGLAVLVLRPRRRSR